LFFVSYIKGGYLYHKNPQGGINVIKGGDEINPFGPIQVSLSGYDKIEIQSSSETDCVIKLSGGNNLPTDTYILMDEDPVANFINQITTYKNQVQTSVVNLMYALIDSTTTKKLKTMTVDCGTAAITVSAVAELLINDCNGVLSDDLFDPEKGLK
jgi:hypothetical protein